MTIFLPNPDNDEYDEDMTFFLLTLSVPYGIQSNNTVRTAVLHIYPGLECHKSHYEILDL
jgi:hypothetical protein